MQSAKTHPTKTQRHQNAISSKSAGQTLSRVLKKIEEDYRWIHLALGLLGNCCFFVGSILFFYPALKQLGIWLFVFGSAGMLVGSIGRAISQIVSVEG